MREKIKAIKQKFRHSMNGIVSHDMRNRGLHYKVNFGLTLPLLKKIAQEMGYDRELAEQLWDDKSVRESMMLAPLLYPIEEITPEVAEQWVTDMPTTEVADMCSKYLFCYAPFAIEKATEWSKSESVIVAYAGFQTATAWLINHQELSDVTMLRTIIHSAIEQTASKHKNLAFAALSFLQQSGHSNKLFEYTISAVEAWDNPFAETLTHILNEERDLFVNFSTNDSR